MRSYSRDGRLTIFPTVQSATSLQVVMPMSWQSDWSGTDDLSLLLRSLVRYCGRKELLAVRALCNKSPRFTCVGALNVDAAVLALECFNRRLRSSFDLIERRLCHHSSWWRHGFSRQRNCDREVAFWMCRGIRQVISEELPAEVELLIATYCNNPFLNSVALPSNHLSRLNNLAFHWHRKFSQGSSGPWRAVRLARKTLANSGAVIFKVAAGIRSGHERYLDFRGEDITEKVYVDTQLVQLTMNTLLDASACMEAHPLKFGQPLQDAILEDQALKDENMDEETRLERLARLGYYAEDERDLRV